MTAKREVVAMVDLVADDVRRIEATFLEPACGTGNFLIEILGRKLAVLADLYGGDADAFEQQLLVAVSSIYGVEIQHDNVLECRQRLVALVEGVVVGRMTSSDSAALMRSVAMIIDRNVIWGDFLASHRCDGSGPIDFVDWSITDRTAGWPR